MKLFYILSFTVIILSCNTTPKPGIYGNYQITTDSTKVNFQVIMQPEKLKLKSNHSYACFKNNDIITLKGNTIGKPLHGFYQEFNFSGKLITKGTFKKGLKNGKWTYYNTKGQVTKSLTYKLGDTISPVLFYKNNKLYQEVLPQKLKRKKEKKDRSKNSNWFSKLNPFKNKRTQSDSLSSSNPTPDFPATK